MCCYVVCVGTPVVRYVVLCFFFFFQAEDGIRDLVRSRGLGDVYKRQTELLAKDVLDKIVARTAGGGAEIVSLLKTGSAYLSLIHI